MINDKKNKVINNKKNEYEKYTVLTLIFVKGQYVEKKKKRKKYRMKVPIQES